MTNTTKIPFLDLITPHHELHAELLEVFEKVLNTAGFIGGPMLEAFENEFALFCGAKHCVGVNSGTDALRFAFLAAGVQPGDIVVTVPHTFIATTEAISQAGARIAFVDIHESTYTMDPEKLREYLETQCEFDAKRGKLVERASQSPVSAVVPVHLYGQTADMDPILELAARYNLIVVEDACQAHGAEYFSKRENSWKKAGSMGHAAAFSFYPGKNLGAYGDGGAVTTMRADLAERVGLLRNHGQKVKYEHLIKGCNSRLDTLQAVVLRVKLRRLEQWNEARRQAAAKYDRLLAGTRLVTPKAAPYAKHVYHLYVVQVPDRKKQQVAFDAANVSHVIHYPIPVHLQPAFADLGYKPGRFPVCEALAPKIISLPMFPELNDSQIERVAQACLKS